MMQHDESMSESKDFPFKVQNMTINEDLGTIQHIFTDKTGTLTSNNMQFQKCVV